MLRIETSNTKRSNSTYLQGCGHVTGTPASDLKVGSTMIWNNGGATIVSSIDRESKCFMWITEEYDGESYPRKLKKDRIVARPVSEL